jgi:NADH:ubiquinone oxidoreductase subunit 6 (subunit J)
MLELLSKIFLYKMMALSVLAALGVVLLPNIFHSALCLVGTLIGIAILYLALQAEFIAVVQILLYVGAVMTLVIFAIMLTHRLGDPSVPQRNKQSLPAAAALIGFFALIASLILKTDWYGNVGAQFITPMGGINPAPTVNTLALGKALLGTYIFPFEVVSIVLVAALIGAVVIARKD